MARSEQTFTPWILDKDRVNGLLDVYDEWCAFYSNEPSPWHDWLINRVKRKLG